MESTYSTSSFAGFVSSNRRLHSPPYFCARPKFKQIDLACPICKYPFGSGGKRVNTLGFETKSFSIICSKKCNDFLSS